MPDREKVIKGLNDIGGFVVGRIGFEQARNFMRTLDDTLALLKEQQEQIDRLIEENASNAEMADGLKEMLKEQEAAYQGAVELLRQKTILFDDAIKRLKEQEELLRKLQKDKDKLCLEVSEWKHKFHDRPEQDKENGHWIILEYCANEGIYCSRCLNKIFDRSTKPKKKLSNYCPNCGSKNTHFFNPSTQKTMYSD